jgi:hypothetical protein
MDTAPLVTIFAEFAKGVLAGIASWWGGKIYIVNLAALVRIKKDIVLLDMLASCSSRARKGVAIINTCCSLLACIKGYIVTLDMLRLSIPAVRIVEAMRAWA